LLRHKDEVGRIPYPPYNKFLGAHWTLYVLAELDFPPGRRMILPLRDQVYDWLFSEEYQNHFRKFPNRTVAHACQVGNALYYSMKLGIENSQTDRLVEWLLEWQWPDGGWNSHSTRQSKSSFTETIEPIRGLWLANGKRRDSRIEKALDAAIGYLLERRLFRRKTDGSVIREEFLRLHFPWYWHYDILLALKVMAETGRLAEPNCREAIRLLQSRRLPNGGFPCDKRFYTKTTRTAARNRSLVDFSSPRLGYDEFITVDAIAVLKKAGAIEIND
jgi:hypothetical protein